MTVTRYITLAIATLAVATGAYAGQRGGPAQQTEVGAWFGSASPDLCYVPAEAGGCPPLVVMMPEILEGGTMVATDTITLANGHLMGQGNWVRRPGALGIKATFMWIQPAFGPAPAGVFRVRLFGQLDRSDHDVMRGTIEPFFFPFGPDGLPSPDPVADALPDCSAENGCLGTFSFTVRRIPTE